VILKHELTLTQSSVIISETHQLLDIAVFLNKSKQAMCPILFKAGLLLEEKKFQKNQGSY